MKSKASILKKLAVRLTTANDISEVQGTSISEIINFITNNANLDADGKLIVKEYVEPVEPGVVVNLLKAPVTAATASDDPHIFSLGYSLGLEVGKSYKLSGTYGANNTELNATAEFVEIEGMQLLECIDEDEAIALYIYDKTAMDENEAPVYDENNAMLIITVIDEEDAPFTLNSITEVEAASGGNLLKAPLSSTDVDENYLITLDYSLGLESGKSYKISGTYGSANTAFEVTNKYKNVGGGTYGLEYYFPDIYNPEASFTIYDKLYYDAEVEDLVASDSRTLINIGTDVAVYNPLIINSITLVEEASGGNLLSAPITHNESIEDTAVLNLDFSVGIEDGKSYTLKGTHGTANTPFEVTALADKANGGDFANMLIDERQNLVYAEVRAADGADLEIIILDKLYMDFDNEISEYAENKSIVLLVNNYSTEEEGLMIPFTINSITLVEEASDGNLLKAPITLSYSEDMGGFYGSTTDTAIADKVAQGSIVEMVVEDDLGNSKTISGYAYDPGDIGVPLPDGVDKGYLTLSVDPFADLSNGDPALAYTAYLNIAMGADGNTVKGTMIMAHADGKEASATHSYTVTSIKVLPKDCLALFTGADGDSIIFEESFKGFAEGDTAVISYAKFAEAENVLRVSGTVAKEGDIFYFSTEEFSGGSGGAKFTCYLDGHYEEGTLVLGGANLILVKTSGNGIEPIKVLSITKA